MHTMVTHIRSWGLKVGCRLNQRETQNIQKVQMGPPEGGWNHRENPKNPKNQIFWHTIRHMAHETPWAICLIVCQKIGFFGFFGFSRWFHLPSGGPLWIFGFASPLWSMAIFLIVFQKIHFWWFFGFASFRKSMDTQLISITSTTFT